MDDGAVMKGFASNVFVWTWLVVFSCAWPAHGDGQWRLLRQDGRVCYLLDTASSGLTSSAPRVLRIRREFKEPGERSYAQDSLEIDCRKGLYRFKEIVLYDRDDDVVNRYRLTDDFSPIPLASFIAEARDVVCALPR